MAFFPFKMAYFFMKGLFGPEDSLISTIATNSICIACCITNIGTKLITVLLEHPILLSATSGQILYY